MMPPNSLMGPSSNSERPRISVGVALKNLESNYYRVILHNGNKTRVVFTEDTISVGCSDITVEAAEYILEQYKKEFPTKKEVVFQP